MRPVRIVIPSGNTQVVPVDYFQSVWSLACIPAGGATYTVQYTLDDVRDPTITPTWFNFPASLVGATTNQQFPGFATATTPQNIMAVQIIVTVSGTVTFLFLQASGADGI